MACFSEVYSDTLRKISIDGIESSIVFPDRVFPSIGGVTDAMVSILLKEKFGYDVSLSSATISSEEDVVKALSGCLYDSTSSSYDCSSTSSTPSAHLSTFISSFSESLVVPDLLASLSYTVKGSLGVTSTREYVCFKNQYEVALSSGIFIDNFYFLQNLYTAYQFSSPEFISQISGFHPVNSCSSATQTNSKIANFINNLYEAQFWCHKTSGWFISPSCQIEMAGYESNFFTSDPGATNSISIDFSNMDLLTVSSSTLIGIQSIRAVCVPFLQDSRVDDVESFLIDSSLQFKTSIAMFDHQSIIDAAGTAEMGFITFVLDPDEAFKASMGDNYWKYTISPNIQLPTYTISKAITNSFPNEKFVTSLMSSMSITANQLNSLEESILSLLSLNPLLLASSAANSVACDWLLANEATWTGWISNAYCDGGYESLSAERPFDCVACSPGTASLGNGAACESCIAGTFSNTIAVTCSNCSPGFYQPLEGQTGCLSCPIGYYQSEFGASTCTQCPNGLSTRQAGGTSLSLCVCDDGKYYDSESNSCFPCSSGLSCDGIGGLPVSDASAWAVPITSLVAYGSATMSQWYEKLVPSELTQPSSLITSAGDGSQFAISVESQLSTVVYTSTSVFITAAQQKHEIPYVPPSFLSKILAANSKFMVIPCASSKVCLGGIVDSQSSTYPNSKCDLNTAGFACGRCKYKYFKPSDHQHQCFACESGVHSARGIFGFVIFCLLVPAIIARWLNSKSGRRSIGALVVSCSGIAALNRSISILDWDTGLLSFFGAFYPLILSSNSYNTHCIFPDANEGAFIAIDLMATPIFLLLGLLCSFALSLGFGPFINANIKSSIEDMRKQLLIMSNPSLTESMSLINDKNYLNVPGLQGKARRKSVIVGHGINLDGRRQSVVQMVKFDDANYDVKFFNFNSSFNQEISTGFEGKEEQQHKVINDLSDNHSNTNYNIYNENVYENDQNAQANEGYFNDVSNQNNTLIDENTAVESVGNSEITRASRVDGKTYDNHEESEEELLKRQITMNRNSISQGFDFMVIRDLTPINYDGENRISPSEWGKSVPPNLVSSISGVNSVHQPHNETFIDDVLNAAHNSNRSSHHHTISGSSSSLNSASSLSEDDFDLISTNEEDRISVEPTLPPPQILVKNPVHTLLNSIQNVIDENDDEGSNDDDDESYIIGSEDSLSHQNFQSQHQNNVQSNSCNGSEDSSTISIMTSNDSHIMNSNMALVEEGGSFVFPQPHSTSILNSTLSMQAVNVKDQRPVRRRDSITSEDLVKMQSPFAFIQEWKYNFVGVCHALVGKMKSDKISEMFKNFKAFFHSFDEKRVLKSRISFLKFLGLIFTGDLPFSSVLGAFTALFLMFSIGSIHHSASSLECIDRFIATSDSDVDDTSTMIKFQTLAAFPSVFCSSDNPTWKSMVGWSATAFTLWMGLSVFFIFLSLGLYFFSKRSLMNRHGLMQSNLNVNSSFNSPGVFFSWRLLTSTLRSKIPFSKSPTSQKSDINTKVTCHFPPISGPQTSDTNTETKKWSQYFIEYLPFMTSPIISTFRSGRSFWMLVLLARQFIFAALKASFINSDAIVECVYVSIVGFIYVAFLLLVRPFNDKLTTFLDIIITAAFPLVAAANSLRDVTKSTTSSNVVASTKSADYVILVIVCVILVGTILLSIVKPWIDFFIQDMKVGKIERLQNQAYLWYDTLQKAASVSQLRLLRARACLDPISASDVDKSLIALRNSLGIFNFSQDNNLDSTMDSKSPISKIPMGVSVEDVKTILSRTAEQRDLSLPYSWDLPNSEERLEESIALAAMNDQLNVNSLSDADNNYFPNGLEHDERDVDDYDAKLLVVDQLDESKFEFMPKSNLFMNLHKGGSTCDLRTSNAEWNNMDVISSVGEIPGLPPPTLNNHLLNTSAENFGNWIYNNGSVQGLYSEKASIFNDTHRDSANIFNNYNYNAEVNENITFIPNIRRSSLIQDTNADSIIEEEIFILESRKRALAERKRLDLLEQEWASGDVDDEPAAPEDESEVDRDDYHNTKSFKLDNNKENYMGSGNSASGDIEFYNHMLETNFTLNKLRKSAEVVESRLKIYNHHINKHEER